MTANLTTGRSSAAAETSPADRGRLRRLLLGAAALQVAGRALDGWWHANHDEFEGASQQLEAHWIIWLGVLATLVVCSVAVRRLAAGDRERAGYVLTLVSGLAYTPVAVWHFVEHANGNDPELAHVLLALAQAGMIVGIVLVFVRARKPRRTG